MADAERFLGDRIELHAGDCREILTRLPENSFDALAADPPYHLQSIVKRFGKEGSAPAQFGSDGRYARASVGFMSKVWDGGDIAFQANTWRAVLRVLKPGAHACVFAIPKHVGFVQVAMQEAGFEFRDALVWAFGSGFPKSHDASKGIDRMLGGEREVVGDGQYAARRVNPNGNRTTGQFEHDGHTLTAPVTDAARQWEGWGTALKPAVELIILARKPLSERTVAANVLKWGTGAININGCRIAFESDTDKDGWKYGAAGRENKSELSWKNSSKIIIQNDASGRWPANLILTLPEAEYELLPFITSDQKRELFRWLSENA